MTASRGINEGLTVRNAIINKGTVLRCGFLHKSSIGTEEIIVESSYADCTTVSILVFDIFILTVVSDD